MRKGTAMKAFDSNLAAVEAHLGVKADFAEGDDAVLTQDIGYAWLPVGSVGKVTGVGVTTEDGYLSLDDDRIFTDDAPRFCYIVNFPHNGKDWAIGVLQGEATKA
jgi:hypothetical protein